MQKVRPRRGHLGAVLAAWVVVQLTPRLASADPKADATPPESILGEDEALYKCKNHTGKVAITFKPETDLKDLVTWVMGFTCKNFMIDTRSVSTAKKVTIIVPNMMTPAEAYRLFFGALSTMGLTAVKNGNVLRIVDAHLAKNETVPIYKSGLPDDTEQVVRYLFRPSYAPSDTLLAAFSALKSDVGDIQLVGSLLMITDYGSHVRDMMSLAKLVDVPGGSDGIYTIPILHADAVKLADKLGGILGVPAGGAAPHPSTPGKPPAEAEDRNGSAIPSKLLVDERTNTLIIASSVAGFQRVKALVDRLDVALDIEGGASIHVVRLGSAVAEDLARTLNDTIASSGSTASQSPSKRPPGAPPMAQPAPPGGGSGEALGTSLEGQVHVTSDKLTNSVIVMASGRDFLAIKDVIAQLDQPRRQVFIETVILEVDISNDRELGVSAHGGIPTRDGSAIMFGGVQTPSLSSLNLASLSTATGLIGGLIGSPLFGSKDLLGKSISSYGILFQALSNTGSTRSVRTPSFIGLDNQKIHWSSGVDIPYKKGVLPATTVTANSPVIQNIDRQKLDLVLDITPHISSDDKVLLEIKHSSQDLGPDQADLGPTWTRQEFETSLVVHDQETIVLEGLTQEREIYTATEVPILGAIPVLGHLFRYSSKIKKRTNTLLMLTPYIIKSQFDLEAIQQRKLREHDAFARSFATLDGMKYMPKIDYGRKRGVIEEINRSLQSVDEDIAARNSFTHAKPVEQGVLDYAPSISEPKP